MPSVLNSRPKKYGIILIHGGLVFLLAGQFMTELFQVESTMRIEVGGTKNYSEAPRRNELAVIDVTDPDKDKVVIIPESRLAQGGEIRTPDLPFALRVEKYLPNSAARRPDVRRRRKNQGQRRASVSACFSPPRRRRTGMDSEDNPAALVQVVSDKGPMGDWTVSTWMTRFPEFENLQSQRGRPPGQRCLRASRRPFNYGGRAWQIALRPVRYYKPYSISLLAFNHDLYPGTDIPKNYSSKIHLARSRHRRRPGRADLHEQSPSLRGETFYQASFEPGDRGTILQVVRNPASITPYVACSLVALGLLTQFLMHLIGFCPETRPAAPTRASARARPGFRRSRQRRPARQKESPMKKWLPWIFVAVFAAWFLSGIRRSQSRKTSLTLPISDACRFCWTAAFSLWIPWPATRS